MKTIYLIFFATVLAACTSITPLKSTDSREATFVETTRLKQKDAFNAMLIYLGKNLGDSNFAIKVKDSESGTIVTQIAIACPGFTMGSLDINKYNAVYNLEVGTKDNKIRFAFEATGFQIVEFSKRNVSSENSIHSSEQLGAARVCAERAKGEMVAALEKGVNKDW